MITLYLFNRNKIYIFDFFILFILFDNSFYSNLSGLMADKYKLLYIYI